MERAVRLAIALQAYAQKDLQKTTIYEKNIDTLIQKTGIREGSFDQYFPTMFSLHGLDIRAALEKAEANKDITPNAKIVAIEAFNSAMQVLGEREYPVLTAEVFNRIEKTLNEFSDILFYNPSTISNETVAALKQKMQEIKTIFKKPYIVAYEKESPGRVSSVKILHNSFSNLRSIVNTVVKKELLRLLKEKKITNSKLLDSNYLTTNILNWGHTRTGDSIISGKLIASLMSLKNVSGPMKTEAMQFIAKDFIKQTGQEKTVIKLHHGDLTKGDAQVLKLVIESNLFQTVIVQNRVENQFELGQLEQKWSLIEAVKRGGAPVLSALGVKSIEELLSLLLRTRASPAPIENIVNIVFGPLSKLKPVSTKKVVNLLNSTVKRSKKVKSIKLNPTSTRSKLKTDTSSKPTVQSTINLESIINASLFEYIKKNMGTGNRRDVLNYRTGRFASSVKVERISESRQGMITAFYSYMKNPYATFSQGGRQQFPRSRDPKLLISKSIREIAAPLVSNRLRAVNV